MKRLLFVFALLISLLFASNESTAQEKRAEKPAALITRFSFKHLYGGAVLLKATFANYADSLSFLLDTGSGGISLDSTTASRFKLSPVQSDIMICGIAGSRKVKFMYNQELKFPGLTIDSLNFHINNYEILTSVYGEKIDGIIGYSVLSRYIVDLNYDSSIISFYNKGSIKYPKRGYLLHPSISRQPVQNASLTDARTIHSKFLFDIGASVCVMFSSDFIKDSVPIKAGRKFYTKEAEGVGGKITMQATVIQEFKLGPYKFKKVPVFIFDDVYNVTAYPHLTGIIGNDLLRRFNQVLNYGANEIYLTPNSHFSEPFDYAYTGLELYYIDGGIIIGNVAVNSPAEKAGLKEGDVVVSINDITNQTISDYRAALFKTGEWAKILVMRDDKAMTFQVRVKSIL
ncbi:MAG: aspartyl protease family protein [Bacteroidota bacterium]